jgi:arginine/lysine/ornithine decarboxylase
MEQILDYLYFETKDITKLKAVNAISRKIFKSTSILKEISETANAFKHCITNNPDKKNAKML